MPNISSQFALSFELTKLPPVRAAISYSSDALIGLVRALKRSGSDFLVEEDLASIFGRGRIEPSLEKNFRDAVQVASISPLYHHSTIVLDAGPGATVGRALKDRYYMSSVIQLSFLTWLHEDTTLATTIVECMRFRFNSGVKGATPDPDYVGVLRTLQACSSQTSQYHWNDLLAIIDDRFPIARPWSRDNNQSSRHLVPSLLLGAMDYFFLIQTLPDDRVVVIDGQTGLLPIIVWAHFILDLVVLVKDSPDGDVVFGNARDPQVIIKWASTLAPDASPTRPPGGSKSPTFAPIMYLLDGSLEVLLKTEPADVEGARLICQEFHRLKGYGTMFLQRYFNHDTLIVDDDPIYEETANFILAFAIVFVRLTRHDRYLGRGGLRQATEVPPQSYLGTEQWRLFASSKLLF